MGETPSLPFAIYLCSTGGVPWVRNDSMVLRRQGWPFLRSASVQHDLLGEPEAEIVFEEFAVALDVDRETVEVVEAPYIAAAGRISNARIGS